MGDTLKDRKVLVIGGSSGAGRTIGLSLAGEGAQVAFAARRDHKVRAAAEKAGPGAAAIACDVCDPESCHEVVERAVEKFGGLDGVIYAPAIIAMSMLMDADADYWESVLRTNVIGAALVTRAAVPWLAKANGRMMYLSSVSASGPPWAGLGVYGTSKAALGRMVESWRIEHPGVLFTLLSIGPIGSEREGDDLPEITEAQMKVLTTRMPEWSARGLQRPELPDTEIGSLVAAIMAGRADVEHLVVQGPG